MNKDASKITTPKMKEVKKEKKPKKPNKFIEFIKSPKTLDITSTVIVVLMHVLFVVAIVLAYRYFAIYPSLILSLLGILICIIVAIDVVYLTGLKFKDKVMKIISVVMALLIFVSSTFGIYYLNKVNSVVSSVIGTSESNETGYEEINGVFVCRSEDANTIKDLSSISGKTIGYVTESERGVATIGMELLDSNNISYKAVVYTSYDELLIGLSDEDVDVAIFLDGYRDLYARNAEEGNADYTGIIADFTDFYPYTGQVEVEKSTSTKDITKDPFNVLLIGYSRTAIGSSIGLADAIIIASVNPQTYTVSMMSIARDSYVPISCYGGTKDKINSARGTSRACFIQTVEDYTGLTMDFYMEADYEAVVAVVDAIGGIPISNPVDFTLDGIYVPAGDYNAWGWQVLEFCRERHHMPNGDFDRQQHQKEVIIAIAEKLLKKGDITLFLNAIEAAGDKFSTNLTLNQLTTMFNMLLSTENYTGLKISKLIDFNQLRLTGYSDWYYNYSMSLPLWIYKVYQGSYDESIAHAEYVLGEVDDTANQTYSFTYDKNNPYDRPLFYSLSYDEEEVHEDMPAYYPNFVGYSYADAVALAAENGYSLNFVFISSDDPSYDSSQDGYVVSQSLRYGTLCSVGSNTLTVMGDGSIKYKFPEYDDMTLNDVKEWCEEKGYAYTVKTVYAASESGSNLAGKVTNMQQDGTSVIITYTSYVSCANGEVDSKTGACTIKQVTVPSTLNVDVGSEKTLTPTHSPEASGITYTWSSSNTNVASVSSSGVVTGVGKGTATITVTSSDGLSAKCIVTVVEKCSTCNGTGEVTCTACNGSGKLTETETCKNCNGSGKVSTETTCTTCGGDGLKDIQCSRWDGIGSVEGVSCEDCGGDGTIQNGASCDATGCVNGKITTETNCTTCGGDGLVEKICTNCSGTGKVTCSKCSGTGYVS